jgi:hypothetical protein
MAHYPPEKAAYLEHQPQWCLAESEKVGSSTHELIRQLLLDGHPYDNLRKAQNILGLRRKYLPAQIEAACQRALKYETTTYMSIKNILARRLEAEPVASQEEPTAVSGTYAFERPVTDFTRDWATQN